MNLKIMTYNTQHCLNYITRKIDYDIISKTILDENPDIVGLEEMRNAGIWEDYQDQIGILAYRTGMYGYFGEAIRFNNGKNPYGVGILSKYPIIKAEMNLIPDPNPKKYNGYYETRGVLVATLDLGKGKTTTACVSHFGLNPDEHENAVSTVLRLVPKTNSIFMGDLNMEPSNPIMKPIFDTFTDTASINEGDPMLTFDSVNPTMKIDYVFTSKDIKTVKSYVPNVVSADHRPFVAIVEV